MQEVKAYFNGATFVPLTPIKAKPNQRAIITIIDDIEPLDDDKPFRKFIGKLSPESYAEITEALLETQNLFCNDSI